MTEDLHALVRHGFAPVRLPDALDDVVARGRRLRRRRRTGTALALVAVLAVGAGLLLSLPPAAPEPDPMRLAAWSVRAEPDGSVRLVIRDLSDPEGLTAQLEAAGVPALVEFEDVAGRPGARCAQDGPENSPLLLEVMPPPTGAAGSGERQWTIRPDRMPSGTSLHFVIFGDRDRFRATHIALVEGNPFPCRLVS